MRNQRSPRAVVRPGIADRAPLPQDEGRADALETPVVADLPVRTLDAFRALVEKLLVFLGSEDPPLVPPRHVMAADGVPVVGGAVFRGGVVDDEVLRIHALPPENAPRRAAIFRYRREELRINSPKYLGKYASVISGRRMRGA